VKESERERKKESEGGEGGSGREGEKGGEEDFRRGVKLSSADEQNSISQKKVNYATGQYY
jgi:hypothetical protein